MLGADISHGGVLYGTLGAVISHGGVAYGKLGASSKCCLDGFGGVTIMSSSSKKLGTSSPKRSEASPGGRYGWKTGVDASPGENSNAVRFGIVIGVVSRSGKTGGSGSLKSATPGGRAGEDTSKGGVRYGKLGASSKRVRLDGVIPSSAKAPGGSSVAEKSS